VVTSGVLTFSLFFPGHSAFLGGWQKGVLAVMGAGCLVFIHPYDDPLVIAGQGTVALEFLRQVPSLETLVVPVGGGGLISGMAIASSRMTFRATSRSMSESCALKTAPIPPLPNSSRI